MHVSIEDKKMIEVIEKLGYKPKKKLGEFKKYVEAGLSGEVYYYELP